MECEVCGNEIYGKAYKAQIDGAKLYVCPACKQFSTAAWKSPKRSVIAKKTSNYPVNKYSALRNTSTSLSKTQILVEKFGQHIRTGRLKLKLSHEELSRRIGAKISVLRKFETGKMVPDQALAKKLEQFLKIKILQSPPETSKLEEEFVKKTSELTLGDVVVVKKRGVEGERDQY